jgi:hypothetical protein
MRPVRIQADHHQGQAHAGECSSQACIDEYNTGVMVFVGLAQSIARLSKTAEAFVLLSGFVLDFLNLLKVRSLACLRHVPTMLITLFTNYRKVCLCIKSSHTDLHGTHS